MTEAPCPGCGEPVEPSQLVCLNCGGRVALKQPTPWAREPVTLTAAVLVAVIVIGAALFGFAISELTSDDGESTSAARDSATPKGPAEAPAVVSGGEQDARTSTEEPPAAPAARAAGAVPGWPDALRAHTVVLLSSGDRAAALQVAKEARASGLEAGMIRSDPYDLGTGLWIVFSGRFTTPQGAERQAAQLAERYPGAYPQLVQKSQ